MFGIEKGAASSRTHHVRTGRIPPFDRCRSAKQIRISTGLVAAELAILGKELAADLPVIRAGGTGVGEASRIPPFCFLLQRYTNIG